MQFCCSTARKVVRKRANWFLFSSVLICICTFPRLYSNDSARAVYIGVTERCTAESPIGRRFSLNTDTVESLFRASDAATQTRLCRSRRMPRNVASRAPISDTPCHISQISLAQNSPPFVISNLNLHRDAHLNFNMARNSGPGIQWCSSTLRARRSATAYPLSAVCAGFSGRR